MPNDTPDYFAQPAMQQLLGTMVVPGGQGLLKNFTVPPGTHAVMVVWPQTACVNSALIIGHSTTAQYASLRTPYGCPPPTNAPSTLTGLISYAADPTIDVSLGNGGVGSLTASVVAILDTAAVRIFGQELNGEIGVLVLNDGASSGTGPVIPVSVSRSPAGLTTAQATGVVLSGNTLAVVNGVALQTITVYAFGLTMSPGGNAGNFTAQMQDSAGGTPFGTIGCVQNSATGNVQASSGGSMWSPIILPVAAGLQIKVLAAPAGPLMTAWVHYTQA